MISRLRRAAAYFTALAIALWTSSSSLAGAYDVPARTASAAFPFGVVAASPLEADLLTDAADGHWDDHTLFAAAAIASGVATEAELLAAKLNYAQLVRDLHNRRSNSQSTEALAAEILAFLHQGPLSGGYDLDATELPQVLASGRFNCVSATVLFNCLATETGLQVGVLRLPQHTSSAVFDGQRFVRVEPTSPRWFAERQRQTGDHHSGASAGLALGDGDGAKLITDVALVAMIYYNRGVEAVRRADFAQAIRFNRLALALDTENADARANLLAAINKQALGLAAREQFAAAALLVEQGLEIDPDHAPLRQNQKWIAKKAQEVRRTAGD